MGTHRKDWGYMGIFHKESELYADNITHLENLLPLLQSEDMDKDTRKMLFDDLVGPNMKSRVEEFSKTANGGTMIRNNIHFRKNSRGGYTISSDAMFRRRLGAESDHLTGVARRPSGWRLM